MPGFRPIIPSHWQMQKKKQNFQRSVCGSYFTSISYDVIHDVFVLFTFAYAKAELIWFDILVSDQCLALIHVLHINSVSDQTFGLRLKFDTLVSEIK